MRRTLLLVAIVGLVGFAGCIENSEKDEDKTGPGPQLPISTDLIPTDTPLWHHPETTPHPKFNYPTLTSPPKNITNPWLMPIPSIDLPQTITGIGLAAPIDNNTGGQGMSLIGSSAIVPSGDNTVFVDLRDPMHPTVVGTFDVGTRGSDTIVYPDGTIAAVLATGSSVIVVVDITDPTNPTEITSIETSGTHKVDVVPGTPIIYNSAGTEIFDLSDRDNPVKSNVSMPNNCHRTYFYIEPAENYLRAICAGYEVTEIWNIDDPMNPQVVVSIPMWHGMEELPPTSRTPQTFAHFAIMNEDHSILLVGDEAGGGSTPPGCTVSATVPGVRTASGPLGNLWFYNIEDEKNPVLEGWVSPSYLLAEFGQTTPRTGSCTAHHGRLIPAEGRDLIAMAFYNAGVVLVDFTDPSMPFIVDLWNGDGTANTWEAWYYNGYIVTGDISRGLDVLKLT